MPSLASKGTWGVDIQPPIDLQTFNLSVELPFNISIELSKNNKGLKFCF